LPAERLALLARREATRHGDCAFPVREPLEVLHGDLGVDEHLDGVEVGELHDRDEREGGAAGACPRGAAYTVHVVLGVRRHVVVHDVADVVDVDTPAHHVRCHENAQAPVAEPVERLHALLLAAVGVHRGGLHVRALERAHDRVRAPLRPREDERPVEVPVRLHERHHELDLLRLVDRVERLVYGLDRRP
jgi:hypothetical protein